MADAVDRFMAEIRADPELAGYAPDIAHAFSALDEEACTNASAAGLWEVLYYVVGHPHHSLHEKLEQVHRLVHLQGRQSGTLRQLTGW
jgi:hypothetical protein